MAEFLLPYFSLLSLDSSRFLSFTRSITHSWFLSTDTPSILSVPTPANPLALPAPAPPRRPFAFCCRWLFAAVAGRPLLTTTSQLSEERPEANRRSSAAGAGAGGGSVAVVPGVSKEGGFVGSDDDNEDEDEDGSVGGGAAWEAGEPATRLRRAFFRARFSLDMFIRSNSSWWRITSLPFLEGE